MRLIATLAVASTVLLAGCIDTNVRQDENMGPLISPDERNVGLNQERPTTFIKRRSRDDARNARLVSLTSPGMPLARVLGKTVPDLNVRVQDPGVNLGKDTVVYAQDMPLDEFFNQLTDLTGYSFVRENNTLKISSRETKTWNIAAMASNRQSVSSVGGETGFSGANSSGGSGGGGGIGGGIGGPGGGSGGGGGFGGSTIGGGGGGASGNSGSGTTISSIQSQDQWQQLVSQVRSYVGLGEDESANDDVQMASVRTLGTITITAAPAQISKVDTFLSGLQDQTTRQIHLDVKSYEVTLNDSRARGINWDAVLETTIGGGPFQVMIDQNNPLSLQADSPGRTSGGISFQNGDDEVSAMIDLLGQYGTVNLLTEPNLSTTNGSTAYLSSVDEFSFVSSVTQFVGTEGTNTITPQLSRIRVGVTMAVTPRLLPDDRILVEVVPVISSLQGFDSFNVGNFQFDNPRIALSELSTQVITRPGEPIQLGGLITNRVTNSMNRLPIRRKTGLLNWLFSSESNELERREMVITITPTLTEV